MVSLDVHSDCLSIQHRSNICSKAFIFWFTISIVTISAPLLIAYRTQGLWQGEVSVREQPKVRYLQELLLLLHTSHGPVYWATQPAVRDLASHTLRQPFIKWHEWDGNHDGVLDGLQLSVSVPLHEQEIVGRVTLLLAFQYTLQRQCEVAVGGGAVVQEASAGVDGASTVTVTGDLRLHQRRPLPCHGRAARTLQPRHLLDVEETSDWSLENVIRSYWDRNVTTRLDNIYTVSQPGPTDTFRVSVRVRYVEQEHVYVANFWHVMKQAWVQYVSLLVVVMYMARLAKKHVYRNQLLHTNTYIDRALLAKFKSN